MTSAQVLVLGPVALADGAGPTTPPAMLQRLIAALVVAEGRIRQTDELVGALWDDAPPSSARKLVRVYVSQLRKLLPPGVTVETVGGGYALRLREDALDADRFERLVAECVAVRRDGDNAALAASLAEQALALWRGRAFGDLAYEEVARAESERLEELRLVAHEERLDAQLALGRQDDVLGEVLALADEHPFRERAHELAMLALYRCGRQAEALEHYRAVRGRLNEELGLEPGPALRELQHRILQQDPALTGDDRRGASPDPLPGSPNPLVGREQELLELGSLLGRRERRLIVLTGAGGSGKTRLALAAARRAAGSYANGVVLVELASLRDPALVLPTIALSVGVADHPGVEPLDALADAVRARELLILLDNLEHLRTAAPSLVALLARAPRLTLLVTSRAVLHVSGESVFPVTPLDEAAAVELFEQRARSLQPGFRVTAENDELVREICRRLDGLPLAIELAAARIGALTPRLLLERLSERLALLTSGARDMPARQQTLRETIDWSVGLLSDGERRVLARLAVFPAGASIEAAESVCGADLDTLASLVDNHVVRRVDADGEPRFGLLETIREYAYELLGTDRTAVERLLAEYLATLVERAELRGPEQAAWLRLLDAELDNLRAAIGYASERDDPELGLRLAGELWLFWWVRGSLGEGLDHLEAALAREPAQPTAARALALRGAAGLAYGGGDLDRATELASTAVAVARDVGARWDEMAGSTILGIVATRRREFDAARGHLRLSARLEEELTGQVVDAWVNLANLELEAGEFAAAAELLERAVVIRRQPGQYSELGTALLNLGIARYRLGEYEVAQACFDEARSAFVEVGFRAHVAHARQGLAACAAATDRFDEAAALLGHAATELAELGWSDDDFDPTLAAEVESATRKALGDEAFAATFAGGEARATMSA